LRSAVSRPPSQRVVALWAWRQAPSACRRAAYNCILSPARRRLHTPPETKTWRVVVIAVIPAKMW